ncbi:extracellular solute-binding protein [Paenibacillus sp. GXUN7292]|uniref:extracellular solute-binding protein n=1 Tax=Paenibacillus sp. GXUN7292 TaxID=3422499 RepID=UPI003D7EB718
MIKRGKLKHVGTIAAVILVLSSLLSACGSKNNENGAEAEGDKPPRIDFLLSHIMSPYAMQYKDDSDIYREELSKLSGYDLHYEFLGHGNDYTQQLTVRFASSDLPDVIRTDSIISTMHPGAVEKDIFTDLTPLLEQYGQNILKNVPQSAWESSKVSKDGKIYGIPYLSAVPAYRVVYIRQDWLDKLNLPQPKTLDEYLEFFEAVKNNDMNGNGDPSDEYGFYVRENLDYGSDLFFKEFGVHPDEWIYRDGQFVPGLIQPEMKESLAFWKMLYDKGYINPNLFTNKGSDWRAGIKQGKAAMWTHDVPEYNTEWHSDLFVNEKDVKIAMLPGPVGPKGQGLTPQHEQIGYVYVIPSSNKNPENVIKYLDWAWSSEEAEKFFAYGIEGHNYSIEEGKVKFDPTRYANAEIDESEMFRTVINPRRDGRLEPLVLDVDPNAELLKQGLEAANQSIYQNEAMHMPVLEAMKARPELGRGAGTLFLDMFAKVVTGKEEIDSSFDKFVAEWKKHGGDEAIQEATEWYKKSKGMQ